MARAKSQKTLQLAGCTTRFSRSSAGQAHRRCPSPSGHVEPVGDIGDGGGGGGDGGDVGGGGGGADACVGVAVYGGASPGHFGDFAHALATMLRLAAGDGYGDDGVAPPADGAGDAGDVFGVVWFSFSFTVRARY